MQFDPTALILATANQRAFVEYVRLDGPADDRPRRRFGWFPPRNGHGRRRAAALRPRPA